MTTFRLTSEYTIECKSEKTRYGFRHLASLQRNGYEIAKDKACYYNRTWESYDFQTVAHGVIRKYFKEPEISKYYELTDKQGIGAVHDIFRSVGMIASLGNLFCDSQEDKNKWKKRMLTAGLPGLGFPDDFDALPEDEKEKRLNLCVNLTLDKGANNE